MRLRRLWVLSAWVGSVLVLVTGVGEWKQAVGRPELDEPSALARLSSTSPGGEVGLMDPLPIAQSAGNLRNRNPFRSDRRPSETPFRRINEVDQPPAEPTPPRDVPSLRLAGVIGGPPWNALFLGIPGREKGLVLGLGESWNGFRFEKISHDSVYLAGVDTTWVLTQSLPRD